MIVEFEYQPLLEDYKKNKDMKLSSILKIFENAGSKHSDIAGDTIINGQNIGKIWVLSDWMLEIIDYPKYGDKILAKTWSEPLTQALFCTRDFQLFCNGTQTVKGTTKWVKFDLSTNRPCKIDNDLMVKYEPEDKVEFTQTRLPRLVAPKNFSNEVEIQIRREDIDFNDHVHNLTYLDYALEALPKDVYDSRDFRNVRISYKNAVKPGDKICCKYVYEDNKHVCCIFGDDGILKTQIELS